MRYPKLCLVIAALALAGCGGGGPVLSQVGCASVAANLFNTKELGPIAISSARVVAAAGAVPEHCRIEGTLSPEAGSSIKFATNVPTNWNGRLLVLGNGGYAGGALPAGGADLANGYATAVTDTGHTAANDATVFRNNRVVEVDYGYRSVHLTTQAAKQITQLVAGKSPTYSYFNGCSTGGRQALMSAQRFPNDFDGIIAGAPAHKLTGLAVEQNWSLRQFWNNNFAGNLNRNGVNKLPLLSDAVKAACADAEGVISNPGACNVEPILNSLQCAGADTATCLTADQVAAVRAVYQGPRSSIGVSWYPGKPVGSEASWNSWLIANSDNPATWYPLQGGFGFSFVGNLFFETDPATNYLWTDFNFDLDPPKGAFMAGILNATNPDLSAFKARKGKLLIYHGTGDGLIGYQPTVDYYQEVESRIGAGTSDFARMFLVHGMDHCDYFDRGGISVSDWLSPLVAWVEGGTAPDSVPGRSKAGGANPLFTRPVCAWPKVATYTGVGLRTDAVNWSCQ